MPRVAPFAVHGKGTGVRFRVCIYGYRLLVVIIIVDTHAALYYNASSVEKLVCPLMRKQSTAILEVTCYCSSIGRALAL